MSADHRHREHAGEAADDGDVHAHAPGKKARTSSIAAAGGHPASTGGLMAAPVQMKTDPFDFGFVQMKGGGSSTATAATGPADPFPGETHGKATSFSALCALIE